MANSLSQLSRGNISTTSLSNGVSPNGSQVKIKMWAFSRSLKEHPKLHISDLEREREIREEREARRLRNHPLCKSINRGINNTRIRMDRLSRNLEGKLQKLEQKARALLPEKDVDLEEAGVSPKLYAIALANSSTALLRAHLSENHDERESESDSDPESVDVLELVCHESLPAARRLRAVSDTPSHAVAASPIRFDDTSILFDRSSISHKRVTVHGQIAASVTSCMRAPRTRDEEEALLDPETIPQPPTTPSSSTTSTSNPPSAMKDSSPTITPRSASSSNATSTTVHTRRVLSISYANGSEEVHEPTIENEDGTQRPSMVVCRWGDGIDEVIPGL